MEKVEKGSIINTGKTIITIAVKKFGRGVLMKKKNYELSKLKHEVYQKLQRAKETIRKLNPYEAEYLSEFFYVEPYLYEVEMNFGPNFNPKTAPGIIKDFYYDFRKNRRYRVFKRLNKKQEEICKEYGLKPKKYKYKIKSLK